MSSEAQMVNTAGAAGAAEASPLDGRGLPTARRLDVYVAAHCLGCAEARRLAAAAARQFPGLAVRTIDVDAAARGPANRTAALPEVVVAVPTYLLDGAVVALGNPEPADLFARIAAETGWQPSPRPSRARAAHGTAT